VFCDAVSEISTFPAYGGPNDIRDEGVGTYTNPSVGSFELHHQPQMVSRGVGPVANRQFSP